MFSNAIVDAFIDDPTVRLIAVLVVLDFALGTLAAAKGGSFRLSYFADVFRNDLIGKVLPYYALWAALHVSGIDWSVGGFDVVEESTGAIVIAALAGSVLNSLRDLGLAKSMPDTVAGPDPETAAPPSNTNPPA
jgi:hypothetical protein